MRFQQRWQYRAIRIKRRRTTWRIIPRVNSRDQQQQPSPRRSRTQDLRKFDLNDKRRDKYMHTTTYTRAHTRTDSVINYHISAFRRDSNPRRFTHYSPWIFVDQRTFAKNPRRNNKLMIPLGRDRRNASIREGMSKNANKRKKKRVERGAKRQKRKRRE